MKMTTIAARQFYNQFNNGINSTSQFNNGVVESIETTQRIGYHGNLRRLKWIVNAPPPRKNTVKFF